MIFLVDYENVKNNGIDGAELLNEEDSVELFFSSAVPNLKQYRLEAIYNSGCELNLTELVAVGKNGLDFYIASRVAELISEGSASPIVIISGDKGYKAIIDYWSIVKGKPGKVWVSETIRQALSIPGLDLRGENIRHGFVDVNLHDVKHFLSKLNAFKANISVPKNKAVVVFRLYIGRRSTSQFYKALVKELGVQQGVVVYNEMRVKSYL